MQKYGYFIKYDDRKNLDILIGKDSEGKIRTFLTHKSPEETFLIGEVAKNKEGTYIKNITKENVFGSEYTVLPPLEFTILQHEALENLTMGKLETFTIWTPDEE